MQTVQNTVETSHVQFLVALAAPGSTVNTCSASVLGCVRQNFTHFLRDSGTQILRFTICSPLAAWRSVHCGSFSVAVFYRESGIVSTSPLYFAVILSSQIFARVQFLGALDD